MWGLAMGLIALAAVKSETVSNLSKLVVLCLCCLLALTANWNYIAVLWIVMFGLLHGSFRRQMIGFCGIGVLFHLIPTYLNFGFVHEGYPHWYQLGVFLAIPMLSLYHGERGKKSAALTYFFYWFYPLHLVLIYCMDNYTALADLIGGLS